MMQYGIKLSIKHPSETKNNFENSYLKSIIFLVKNRTFYNITNKIEIFCILGQVWYLIVSIPDLCNLTYFGLQYFADSWFGMFLVQIYRQK